MEIYKKIFGQRLRAARLRVVPKLTQAGLAELIGVEPPSVSRWETGIDFPEDMRLPAICEALKVPIEYFTRDPKTNVAHAMAKQAITNRPQSETPDWFESARMLQLYLEAEPDTRLLALYILTDDDKYLAEYEATSDAPELAALLKKIL